MDTGKIHEFGRMATRGTAGDEELYLCCTLEEALRIGCRFAPALDSEARFSNITWEWMGKDMGWEPPLLDEEFDLYSSNPTQRHFLREEGDVGLNGKAGELAWSFFGGTKDEPFDQLLKDEKYFVRGSDGEFNAAPGELKQAFFAGREHLDKPAGSWGSNAWPLLRDGEPIVPCDEDAVRGAAPRSGDDAEFDEELPADENGLDFENIPDEDIEHS
ncbi:MAG: hypothetical protein B6245_14425 [Desulfobacteraceae bacterium 4572_88]|nr:MAG: hypothetical protein B6245_14425 [Desulfobacteraceae bacterium 4572_88]